MCMCKNGEMVLVLSWWIVLCDKLGQLIVILFIDSDIMKVKLFEVELCCQKEELVVMIDVIFVMVWSIVEDGWLLYFNWCWIDYDVRMCDGMNVWCDIVYFDDIVMFEVVWYDVIMLGSLFEVMVWVQFGSGEYCCMIIGVVLLCDGDGWICCWYGVNMDIEVCWQVEQVFEWLCVELVYVMWVMMFGELVVLIVYEVMQLLVVIVILGEVGFCWFNYDVLDFDEVWDLIEQMIDDVWCVMDIIWQICVMVKCNDWDDVCVDVMLIVE